MSLLPESSRSRAKNVDDLLLDWHSSGGVFGRGAPYDISDPHSARVWASQPLKMFVKSEN